MWHPSLDATLFFSVEKSPSVYSFDLSNGTVQKFGHSEGQRPSSVMSFSLFGSDKIVSCTEDSLSIFDLKDGTLKTQVGVPKVFDIQICKYNPVLISLSQLGGKTELTTIHSLLSENTSFSTFVPEVLKNKAPFTLCGTKIIGKKLLRFSAEKVGLEDKMERLGLKEKEGALWEVINVKNDEDNRKKISDILVRRFLDPDEVVDSHLSFNKKDRLTLLLIDGDYEGAFLESLKNNEDVCPVSHAIALIKGKDFIRERLDDLKKTSMDVRMLLLFSTMSGDYKGLIERTHVSDWYLVVSSLCNSGCSDDCFKACVSQVGDRLQEEGSVDSALICYAISEDMDKYFALRSKQVKMPETVFEVKNSYREYECVVEESILLGGKLKGELFDEYMKYLLLTESYPVIEKCAGIGSSEVEHHLKKKENVGVVKGAEEKKTSPSLMPAKRLDPPKPHSVIPNQVATLSKGPTLQRQEVKPPRPAPAPLATSSIGLAKPRACPPPMKTTYAAMPPVRSSRTAEHSPVISPKIPQRSETPSPKSVAEPDIPLGPGTLPSVGSSAAVPKKMTYAEALRRPSSPPRSPAAEPTPSKPVSSPRLQGRESIQASEESKKIMGGVREKVDFLKESAPGKKGIIYRNAVNKALEGIAVYEKGDKSDLTDSLVKSLDNMFNIIDIDEIKLAGREKKLGEVKRRVLPKVRSAYDSIVVAHREANVTKTWLPGVIELLRVVLSE
jgi:hypothetical protein